MGLREYKSKRNFKRTQEPAGKVPAKAKADELLFVVQKHDASRLHYDFRLEMEGVLKSWAVPKGFPTKRGDRRLAVEVEDHPIEYGDFEGTIPEGNYGAGTVMLWDAGVYAVSGGDPWRALKEGKLHLTLKGSKLKGDWTLVRMRPREREDKPQWLLLKSGEDVPEISARQDDRSVQSRRSMAQIAGQNNKQWQSTREAQSGSRRLTKNKHPEPVQTRSSRIPAAVRARVEPRTKTKKTGGEQAETRTGLDELPQARAAFVEPREDKRAEEVVREKPRSVKLSE